MMIKSDNRRVTSYLNEAEHLCKVLTVLPWELESHLCVLLLPERCTEEVILDEINYLEEARNRRRAQTRHTHQMYGDNDKYNSYTVYSPQLFRP